MCLHSKRKIQIKFVKEIREITGKNWREVIGQAMIFMWPRVIEGWLKDKPEHKWFKEGGSDKFYK